MKYEVSAVLNAPAATPNDSADTPNGPEVATFEQHDRLEKPEDGSWKMADGVNELAETPNALADRPNGLADWPWKLAD